MYPEELKKYIPPEFDLSKYEDTAHIDLWDWSCNLAKRCGLRCDMLEEEITLDNIENGVVIADKTGLQYGDPISILREITCSKVLTTTEALNEQFDVRNLHSAMSTNEPIEDNEESVLNEYISDIDVNTDWLMLEPAWLEVDMLCSDKEIKAAFDRWLNQYRDKDPNRHTKRKRREYKLNEFSPATLRRWHDAKILAFLDIEAWNYLQDNKLTDALMGEILFSEYKNQRNNADYVRNKVKPLAELLSSQDVLMRMRKVFIESSRQKNA